MSPALWMALGASVPVVLLGLFLARRALVRQGHEHTAAASREEVAQLRAELDALRAQLAASQAARTDVPTGGDFVITTAGVPAVDAAAADRVPERVVLSAALGEPLVKVASLAYGVGRVLSPRTRNRIAFEMRREVKRARKQRRRAARRARIDAAEVEDAA